MLYRVHLAKAGLELTTLVVIDTDCIVQLPYDHDHDGSHSRWEVGNEEEKTTLLGQFQNRIEKFTATEKVWGVGSGRKKKYFVAATIKCAYSFPKSKKRLL
jgi:hypothetical protein